MSEESKNPGPGELEGGNELNAKSKGGEGTRNAEATPDISVQGVHGQTRGPGDPGQRPEESSLKQ